MNILETRGVSAVGAVIAIVILAAIGIGAYFMTSNKTEDSNNQQQEQIDSEETSGQGSLKGLLALGRNITCTFEREDETGDVYGTIYVSGEQMRGDFKNEAPSSPSFTKREDNEEDEMESHMIRTDGMMYVWTGNQGMRFTETSATESDNNQSLSLEDQITYQCSHWDVDGSKFEVPGGITFSDLPTVMGNPELKIDSSASTTPNIQIDCSACDQVPEGSGRDQCRVALGC